MKTERRERPDRQARAAQSHSRELRRRRDRPRSRSSPPAACQTGCAGSSAFGRVVAADGEDHEQAAAELHRDIGDARNGGRARRTRRGSTSRRPAPRPSSRTAAAAPGCAAGSSQLVTQARVDPGPPDRDEAAARSPAKPRGSGCAIRRCESWVIAKTKTRSKNSSTGSTRASPAVAAADYDDPVAPRAAPSTFETRGAITPAATT